MFVNSTQIKNLIFHVDVGTRKGTITLLTTPIPQYQKKEIEKSSMILNNLTAYNDKYYVYIKQRILRILFNTPCCTTLCKLHTTMK